MIEVKNIKKSFGGKAVIQDVSCVMKAGQCNLIIGSSGSGKTVLQKCMVGLFEPDEGHVGKAEVRCGEPESAHLERLESALFDEFGRYDVVRAGADERVSFEDVFPEERCLFHAR